MDKPNSSKSDYVLPSTLDESKRLEEQATLYSGTDFLGPFLKERPGSILDVGCGTGFFSRYVAKTLPSSSVVGVDENEERLEFAREKARGIENLVFKHAEALDLPFKESSFDLVFSRFLMVHMQEPEKVLLEMARVAKPGARIVAYDMVHDGIWFSPVKKAFSLLLGKIIEEMRNLGMEPSQGLHLATAMVRADLCDVDSNVVAHYFLASDPMFELYRKNWIQTLAGIDKILGKSFDRGLVDDALEELADKRPDQALLEISIIASGRKKEKNTD